MRVKIPAAFIRDEQLSSYLASAGERRSPPNPPPRLSSVMFDRFPPSPARLLVNVHLAASRGYALFSASQRFPASAQAARRCRGATLASAARPWLV